VRLEVDLGVRAVRRLGEVWRGFGMVWFWRMWMGD
jgi:hypothetical protein